MVSKKIKPSSVKQKKTERRRINFQYHAVDAQNVYVAGDFNKWNEVTHPMKQKDDGIWEKTMVLPKGCSYEYKFIVDGVWLNDPMNEETCVNAFGTVNNKLKI